MMRVEKKYLFAIVFHVTSAQFVFCVEDSALLYRFDISPSNQAETQVIPKGIHISFDETNSTDGNGSFRYDCDGSQSGAIKIASVEKPDLSNCVIEYRAKLRTENLSGKAYLEMLCAFDQTEFYSKGLDHALSGTNEWTELSTPFFLKEGQYPERVTFGLRVEGSGSVWIDDIRLVKTAFGLKRLKYNWQWIPGTLLGIFGGLYGSLAGLLGPKGRGRAFVLGLGIFFDTICVVMLIVGIVFLAQGRPWGDWYAFLLPGVVGIAVFTPMLPVILMRYRQAESRVMSAKDMM